VVSNPVLCNALATQSTEQRLAVVIASDDEAAKAIVNQLTEDGGDRPFELGTMKIPGSFSSSDNLTLDAAFKRRLQVLGY
jgi:8-hydroxy-5-deazaflavin:NADPH oxidoreductase